ncbi:MAG: RNA-binding domain-containing protein [Rhodospirillaceae bacterium]
MDRARELFDRIVDGGVAELDRMIAEKVSEELYLDYKRTSNEGCGKSLGQSDQKNYSKAISGFANSAGGVIIWGMECRPDPDRGDVPSRKVPIENPERFKSLLESASAGLTFPAYGSARHECIIDPNGGGYVVTLIPEGTTPPYQTIRESRYYMRAGSNFLPVPHAVLSGMFGRKPQPQMDFMFVRGHVTKDIKDRVSTSLGLVLVNFGRGIAEDVYLNVDLVGTPGQECQLTVDPPPPKDTWMSRFTLGAFLNLIAHREVRIAPMAQLHPIEINVVLKPPFNKSLVLRAVCGASGCEATPIEIDIPSSEIQAAYELVSNSVERGRAPEDISARFFSMIFPGIHEKAIALE